jgi:hypothetical protein
MKLRKTESRKIVVMPSTRRGECDVKTVSQNKEVGSLLDQLKEYEELEQISSRLADYAATTGKELQKLRLASETKELDTVQKGAETLAHLSAELGATGMLRVCYQVLIAARQGQFEVIQTLQNTLNDEFVRFKATLRVAT